MQIPAITPMNGKVFGEERYGQYSPARVMIKQEEVRRAPTAHAKARGGKRNTRRVKKNQSGRWPPGFLGRGK